MKEIEIISVTSGPFYTNSYIVISLSDGQAAIIDPSPDSAKKIKNILMGKNLTPTSIILTHSHWDHIADVKPLKDFYSIPVYIHRDDGENLVNPGSDGLPLLIEIEGVEPTQFLKDNDTILIGQTSWKVLHTPGHSPGSICLYCEKEHILLSGDTLFKGTIGNISFPTSMPDKMWDSLKKLAKLPHETVVFAGHGPRTSIKEETWLDRAREFFG